MNASYVMNGVRHFVFMDEAKLVSVGHIEHQNNDQGAKIIPLAGFKMVKSGNLSVSAFSFYSITFLDIPHTVSNKARCSSACSFDVNTTA